MWERHVDPLEVVLPGAAHQHRLAAAAAARGGHRDRQLPGEVAAGERAGERMDDRRLALSHHLAAVDAGAGAEVDQPVGLAHRLLVVLDHQHGVAEVAHPLQRRQQLAVVSLVQPDRRLVEDVEHAHQLGADLGGQADALRLAARQRAGGAVEGQVVEAHRGEEAEAVGDLLQDLGGDVLLALGQRERAEPGERVLDRERHHLDDVAVADAHRERLAPQPPAAAVGARGHRHEALDLGAALERVGLAVEALEHLDQPLERGAVLPQRALADELEVELLLAGAEQDRVPHLLGQALPRLGEGEPHRGRQRLELAPAERGPALLDDRDGAVRERALGVDDELLGVDLLDDAEAGARRAGALRRVEREQPRRQLGEREAAARAGVAGGEDEVVALRRGDAHHALADLERGLERVGEAVAEVVAHLEAVDHHLDGVLLLLVEVGRRVGVDQLAVDARAHEPLARHLLEQLAVLALLRRGQRREHHEAAAGRQRGDAVDHLLRGLALDREVAVGARRHADRGEQQAQVVVDLGDGADRRARVLRGGLLLDRDRGREPVDGVDVGLVHLLEELARVRRQRLDVAPLPLGEQGVERERRLPRPRHAGDHDEPVARDVEIDVLQVVLARTADGDDLAHAPSSPASNAPEPLIMPPVPRRGSTTAPPPAGAALHRGCGGRTRRGCHAQRRPGRQAIARGK